MEGPVSAPAADRGTRTSRFTESVNWTEGRVSTTGQLTSAAADLLGGTAEQLCRAGHAHVTVELHAVDALDDAGLAALRAVADDLRVRHCELVVLWRDKENML
jgi:anti-anti-sigma regulatory factor